MKKLKRFSIFILVGILLFSILFPACGKDNQSGNKQENVKAERLLFYPASSFDIKAKEFTFARTRLELVDFLAEDIEIPEKYTADFFTNSALVVFLVVESSTGNVSAIQSYTIDDATIYVDVETIQFGDDCGIAYYYFLLEVTQEEIKNVTQFERV